MKGSKIMKKGFTLAEVLITLAIIGVVAALTIPSVILNTNQTEYKTGLKKAVSVLNQAVSLELAIDNFSPSETNASATSASAGALIHILQNQMNTIQAASGACANGAAVNDGTPISSTNCAFTTTDGMQFILPSSVPAAAGGTAAGTGEGLSTFTQNFAGCRTTESNATGACYLIVDVNGAKNPNKMTTDPNAPSDRFLIMFKGENGTTVTPAGFGANVMFK